MAEYAIWLCDDVGRRIRPLDEFVTLDYVKVINGVGWFSLVYGEGIDPELFQVDSQVHVYRRPTYKDNMSLDFIGFLRAWNASYRADTFLYTLSGPDQNDILDRRIVAYAAGTASAQLSAVAADDGLKDIFNTNFIGGATDTARRLTSMGGGVTVQADATAGPTITKGYSWRNVLKTMLDIAEDARTQGTEIFFELAVNDVDEKTGLVSFEFRTAAGLPGRDLTSGGGLPPVIFGTEFGNVSEFDMMYDYRDERNDVYAGGQGEGAKRYIAQAEDNGRIFASAWNRRELFVDARNEETTTAVDGIADAKLAEYRPQIRFEARILDTQQARYGIDWALGDKVTIRELGDTFNGLVRRVHVKASSNGQEDINVKVLSEDV